MISNKCKCDKERQKGLKVCYISNCMPHSDECSIINCYKIRVGSNFNCKFHKEKWEIYSDLNNKRGNEN